VILLGWIFSSKVPLAPFDPTGFAIAAAIAAILLWFVWVIGRANRRPEH
jgi:hypothetical protein